MTWQNALVLLAAIASEVTATLALKETQGFTKLWPSVLVLLGYGLSFYLLSLLLKFGVPVGMMYAIWSGLGTVGVVVAGWLLWQERINVWTALGILLVIGGVVIINTMGNGH